MKRKNLAMGLSLTILVALLSGGIANAKGVGTSTHTPMNDGEPVQSQNIRQKTPHSNRKAAATRLKVEFKAAKSAELSRQMSEHSQGQKHEGGAK